MVQPGHMMGRKKDAICTLCAAVFKFNPGSFNKWVLLQWNLKGQQQQFLLGYPRISLSNFMQLVNSSLSLLHYSLEV